MALAFYDNYDSLGLILEENHQAQEGSEQAWKQCFLSSEQGPDLLDLADLINSIFWDSGG